MSMLDESPCVYSIIYNHRFVRFEWFDVVEC